MVSASTSYLPSPFTDAFEEGGEGNLIKRIPLNGSVTCNNLGSDGEDGSMDEASPPKASGEKSLSLCEAIDFASIMQ